MDKAVESGIKAPFEMIPPVKNPRITSSYGNRILNGVEQFHNGVDLISNDLGVCSCGNGQIVANFWHDLGGWTIWIDHGQDWQSRYCHLAEQSNLKIGHTVRKGQKFATMGNTGHSFGVHLHFGLYYKKKTVNPEDYIKL